MAKFELSKMSDPGWDVVGHEKDLCRLLYSFICETCKEEDKITPKSSLADMLNTPCGCEFSAERLE